MSRLHPATDRKANRMTADTALDPFEGRPVVAVVDNASVRKLLDKHLADLARQKEMDGQAALDEELEAAERDAADREAADA